MSYVGSISSPYESTTFGTSLSLKVKGGFNAVSINPSGRDVVLASRSGLFIIDLDDPFSPPRWLHHVTPWQVADVQWYPHPAKPYWVVSTSNQKAIIWNLTRSSTDAIEYALHGHSRAITDINFNPQHPDILATCSIDTYVHAWDLRSPSRPFYSTSSWESSASQVKWNYRDPNILASSHGNDVFIWDVRQGSSPLLKLEGHESGVNSIDFNRFKRGEIMSSSNDGTVKFWDITKGNTCLKTISADFPIWRGRYLPFGNGYCIMPTVGGNNSVFMMSLDGDVNSQNSASQPSSKNNNNNFTINNDNTSGKVEKLQPVHTFKGHNDRVIDFLWRSRHSQDSDIDDRDFQLVTWSEDSDLRLWPISDEIYDKVNFERNMQLKERLPNHEYISFNRCDSDNNQQAEEKNNGFIRIRENFVTTSGLARTEDINHLNWLSGVKMNRQDSQNDLFEETKLQNLGEEVSSIGHKFPKIVFEKISVSTGELVLTLNGPWCETNPETYIFLRIGVKLSPHYPSKGNLPKFEIEENNNLLPEYKQKILSKLTEIGKAYTDLNQYCLEPCLRYLLGEKVNLDDIEDIGNEPLFNFDINSHLDFVSYSSLSDMEEASRFLDSSSSESESELLKSLFDTEQVDSRNTFGRNLAFDSTPVPNECGATWSPNGTLLTFFVAENKVERVTFNNLKLSEKTLLKKQNSSSYEPQELFDGRGTKSPHAERPKRYVDTFSAQDNATEQEDVTTVSESSSGSSFESFVDDWNDVIGNDILVRTKLPALYDNFARTVGSIPSESARTDASKKIRNIIMETDFSYLTPDSKSMALEYQMMDGLPGAMARNNALVAEKYGFDEISHCWQILSDLLMGEANQDPFASYSESHPGTVRWFVREALKYFEKEHNLQMIAMLCCVLAYQTNTTNYSEMDMSKGITMESTVTFDKDEEYLNSHASDVSSFYSRYSASVGHSTVTNSNLFDTHLKRNHLGPRGDNSSLKSREFYDRASRNNQLQPKASLLRSKHSLHPYSQPHAVTVEKSSHTPVIKVQLLDDEIVNIRGRYILDILDMPELSKYKSCVYQYANLLFQWMLPIERAKILKVDISALCKESCGGLSMQFANSSGFREKTTPYGVVAQWLKNPAKELAFYNCNYCQLRVAGDAFICGNCEHVLHRECAREWWNIGEECATGCGCDCVNFFDVQ